MAYESPTYRIEERIGKIELRRYEPYVVAETLVEGSLERAGTPKDARVTISEVGPQLLAAIRYGGRWTRTGYERHLAMLREALEDAGRTVVGEPIWARYDPPWTPWFRRRNEVLIAVDE